MNINEKKEDRVRALVVIKINKNYHIVIDLGETKIRHYEVLIEEDGWVLQKQSDVTCGVLRKLLDHGVYDVI